MKTLSTKASQVLNALTNGVDYETPKRVDNSEGTYMPVVVSRLGETCFSVGHYFKRQGDLMSDPEVIFHRSAEGWHPAAITMHPIGYYREAITFADGEIVGYRPRALDELVTFCNHWMMMLLEQQDLAA